jgi:hypothetical protein
VNTPAEQAPSAPRAIERTLTLKALDRTLQFEAVSASGANARVIAVERDAAAKVLAYEDGVAGAISIVSSSDGHSLLRLGRSSFSLTPKGAARVQSWLLQLHGAP